MLSADAERFRGALVAAAAWAALERDAAIFLQLDAVVLLRRGEAPRDAAHREAGLPVLEALLEDALELGVRIEACQTGLALHEIDTSSLDPRISVSGPVAFLRHAPAGASISFV